MPTPKDKKHKGGVIVRFDRQGATVINVDPTIKVDFEKVGCMMFCENIQGYHLQLTKEFAKGFDGLQEKVGTLTFPVTDQSIVEATEIPLNAEE